MSASQPMQMEPSPSEKSIKAFFVSTVHTYEAATVVFPRVMSVRESEFVVKQGLTATLRIPVGQFEFYVDTIFPGQSEAIRVSANVVGAQVDALTIEQNYIHNLLIDIQHTAMHTRSIVLLHVQQLVKVAPVSARASIAKVREVLCVFVAKWTKL